LCFLNQIGLPAIYLNDTNNTAKPSDFACYPQNHDMIEAPLTAPIQSSGNDFCFGKYDSNGMKTLQQEIPNSQILFFYFGFIGS